MEVMDWQSLTRLVLALIFVLCLIGIVATLVKQYGHKLTTGGQGARLGVLEWRQLDARHRLVLVRRDNREHLLILTQNSPPLVVESGIERVETSVTPLGPAR
jgi:flagellar protein FliO/FliZ